MGTRDYSDWVNAVLVELQTKHDEDERVEAVASALNRIGYMDDEITVVVRESFSAGLSGQESQRFAERIRKRVVALQWQARGRRV
jgi:hypothetical protein